MFELVSWDDSLTLVDFLYKYHWSHQIGTMDFYFVLDTDIILMRARARTHTHKYTHNDGACCFFKRKKQNSRKQ